jgi:signal transduction histidine kinase
METHCTEFSHRTNLPINLEIDAVIPVLPDIFTITLYRVLQEALTNIIKHAQAAEVWVDLTVEDKTINLTVQDNGHGFDVANTQSNGIGLAGLRERVTLAGGKFNISSSPVRGTILLAQFPLPEEAKTTAEKEPA